MTAICLYVICSSLTVSILFYHFWRLGFRRFKNKSVATGIALTGYLGASLCLRWFTEIDPRIHQLLLESLIQLQYSTSLTIVHIFYFHLGMITLLTVFCWRHFEKGVDISN